MSAKKRSNVVTGSILIALGLGLFILQFAEDLGGEITLIFLGGVFLALYFNRGQLGFLIPGCILSGLGVGKLIEQLRIDSGEMGQIGLGVGFIAIAIIQQFKERQTVWWPLIPGGFLIFSGLAQRSDQVARLLSIGWPLLFVLIGAWLILWGKHFQNDPTPDQKEE